MLFQSFTPLMVRQFFRNFKSKFIMQVVGFFVLFCLFFTYFFQHILSWNCFFFPCLYLLTPLYAEESNLSYKMGLLFLQAPLIILFFIVLSLFHEQSSPELNTVLKLWFTQMFCQWLWFFSNLLQIPYALLYMCLFSNRFALTARSPLVQYKCC